MTSQKEVTLMIWFKKTSRDIPYERVMTKGYFGSLMPFCSGLVKTCIILFETHENAVNPGIELVKTKQTGIQR